jgi:hypothetical protein
MVMRLWFAALLALVVHVTTSSGQVLKDERLYGDWVIDVEQTEAYLRSNRVMPEKALEKMRPIFSNMRLKFGEKRAWKIGATPEANTEFSYTVIALTATKTVFTSPDIFGEKVTATIRWDGNGYWQETTMFPGYRERFKRPVADSPAK